MFADPIGASPPHPLMNAWLPKNSNLTQAKIFLLHKNISFGLGLNFWLVHPDIKCKDC